jgi:hypothetical protein
MSIYFLKVFLAKIGSTDDEMVKNERNGIWKERKKERERE